MNYAEDDTEFPSELPAQRRVTSRKNGYQMTGDITKGGVVF